MIIHIIIYKLFLETNYWSWISVATGILSIFLYYLTLLIGNTETFANTFQPELMDEFFNMLINSKFYIMFFCIPFIALLPDSVILLIQKVFFPTPTDKVMHEQADHPKYVYEQNRVFELKPEVSMPPIPVKDPKDSTNVTRADPNNLAEVRQSVFSDGNDA